MKINTFLVKSLTKQAKKCALGVIESLGDLFDIFYYKNASKFLYNSIFGPLDLKIDGQLQNTTQNMFFVSFL